MREHYQVDLKDWELYEYDQADYQALRGEQQARKKKPKIKPVQERASLAEELHAVEKEIEFTYQASRFEKQWLTGILENFYRENYITDVLKIVKKGKEATVYCCKAHPSTGAELLAAKVYRPRMLRNLKNDAPYKEGRAMLADSGQAIHDRRSQLAIRKKTHLGGELDITSWIEHEFQTLNRLHAAGADVPRPVVQSGKAILMEYLGEVGNPAPALSQVTLEKEEAQNLFDRLIINVLMMLENHLIHADLSAYNVLYWEGQVKIIDFPQVVDPLYNPRAFELLHRDLERLVQYFHRYGVRENASRLAEQMWDRIT